MAEKRSHFWAGVLIYVLLFGLAAFLGLKLLYDYMEVYEATRPARALEQYEAAFRSEEATPAVHAALGGVDAKLQSEEEAFAWVRGELLSQARFSREGSDGENIRYRVISGGRQIGSFRFVQGEEQRFGLRVWRLAEESYDFSAWYQTVGATIPPDYSFVVNGTVLDESYVTERDIPYETLESFYERYEDLPMMLHVESGPFFGTAVTEVRDAEGRTLAPEELDEQHFLDRCPDRIRELSEEFVPRFLELYVDFSANLYGAYYYNFMQLRPLVLTDSPLHDRMQRAFESFGYTTTDSAEILSIEQHLITQLSEDRYLVDLSYDTEIVAGGGADPVVIRDNIRLVVYEHKDYLLAEALFNY